MESRALRPRLVLSNFHSDGAHAGKVRREYGQLPINHLGQSRHESVLQFTDPLQHRYRHQAEQTVMKPVGFIAIRHEPVVAKIEPVIVNRALLCPPSQLVLTKTFICNRGPAKVERSEALRLQATDRLPHHKIVAAEAQIVLIRSAKLIMRLHPMMQKDGSSDWSVAGSSYCYESLFLLQQPSLNVVKEFYRLRRDSVFLSSETMKAVIGVHQMHGTTNFHGDAVPFGLPHLISDSAFQSLK
jgi:hypothetical protein